LDIQIRKDRDETHYEIIVKTARTLTPLLCVVSYNHNGEHIDVFNMHGKQYKDEKVIEKVKSIIKHLDILGNIEYNKFYKIEEE